MDALLLQVAAFIWTVFAPPGCGPAEPIAETYADGGRFVGIIAESCEYAAGFDIGPDGSIMLTLAGD